MNEELINKYIADIDKLGHENTLALNTKDVSKILKVSIRTLENLRKDGGGPNFIKIAKSFLYSKRDVAEFLAKD